MNNNNRDQNILVVIQARKNSSRLPGKIFLSLSGKPLLYRMYERVCASVSDKKVVIATTTDKADDETAELCVKYDMDLFRGHPDDLLDRHYKAGTQYDADVVIKIPSDCPLICPDVIDNVINFYKKNINEFDFVSNLHPATYPDGQDVEIIPMVILKQAWTEAKKNFEREHTTPFIWERPERFRIGNFVWETGLDLSMSYRLTIDYPEDYEFIKKVYDELYDENKMFKLCDIMMLLDKKPEIKKINEMYNGVNWYRNHLSELKTVSHFQTSKIRREKL